MRSFTLVEMMVVIFIFTLLFGAVIMVLATSDKSWRTYQNKLIEQQEARKAMDYYITVPLRQSSPDWIINGTHYPVTITSNRIDFYKPFFDSAGNIFKLSKVTFKLNPDNLNQLLKKEGTQDAVVIANNIESINFGGGCPGCSSFNCSTVADDCPIVKIEIKTKRESEFTLVSQVTLRNQNVTLSEDVEIEEPSEGEF